MSDGYNQQSCWHLWLSCMKISKKAGVETVWHSSMVWAQYHHHVDIFVLIRVSIVTLTWPQPMDLFHQAAVNISNIQNVAQTIWNLDSQKQVWYFYKNKNFNSVYWVYTANMCCIFFFIIWLPVNCALEKCGKMSLSVFTFSWKKKNQKTKKVLTLSNTKQQIQNLTQTHSHSSTDYV